MNLCFYFSWVNKDLGVEGLGHVVDICLTFKKLSNHPTVWLYHYALPPAVYDVPALLHPHQSLVWSVFFIMDILIGL